MKSYNEEIESLCEKLPRELVIAFAIYCAEDCFQYVEDKDKAIVRYCIDTTKAYMSGRATKAELNAAASAAAYAASAANAAHAANAAAHAANAAAHATYAYNAATYAATYAAAHAANAATYAAAHAANSATYAASAADTAEKQTNELKKYLAHLNKMIKDLSPLEKLLYNLDVK